MTFIENEERILSTMKGKRILKLALSMITAVMICPTVNLANAESSLASDGWEIIDEKTTHYVEESKSALQYEKLMDSFEETGTGKLIYPNYYGGSYINDNGDFVVCTVAENAKEKEYTLKSIKENINLSDFEIKNVKYSYNELEKMMALLNEYKQNNRDSKISKNWSGHFLSDLENTIFVELNDMDDEQISLFRKEVTDSPMITFINSGGQGVNCANLNPGRGINNSTIGVSGSMGYRARTNGKIGFVTAAHVGYVGNVIEGTSSTIGKITARQNWGSVDAAFVEITSAHTPTNILNGTDATLSTSIKNPAQGATVHKRGAVTGHSSGVIYSTNASKEFDNTLFTNLTYTSLKAESGDSGGIVYYNVTSGSTTTRYTSGIVKGLDANGTYYTKASLINSALGITRY